MESASGDQQPSVRPKRVYRRPTRLDQYDVALRLSQQPVTHASSVPVRQSSQSRSSRAGSALSYQSAASSRWSSQLSEVHQLLESMPDVQTAALRERIKGMELADLQQEIAEERRADLEDEKARKGLRFQEEAQMAEARLQKEAQMAKARLQEEAHMAKERMAEELGAKAREGLRLQEEAHMAKERMAREIGWRRRLNKLEKEVKIASAVKSFLSESEDETKQTVSAWSTPGKLLSPSITTQSPIQARVLTRHAPLRKQSPAQVPLPVTVLLKRTLSSTANPVTSVPLSTMLAAAAAPITAPPPASVAPISQYVSALPRFASIPAPAAVVPQAMQAAVATSLQSQYPRLPVIDSGSTTSSQSATIVPSPSIVQQRAPTFPGPTQPPAVPPWSYPGIETQIASSYGILKPVLPIFDSGRESDFVRLKMALDYSMNGHAHLTEHYKFQVLLGQLKLQSALELARAYMYDSKPYTAALGALQDRYGQPRQLVQSELAAIFNSPAIKSEDAEAFDSFALSVQSLVGMLRTLEGPIGYELGCGSHVDRLLSKLPPPHREGFVEHCLFRGILQPGTALTYTLPDLAAWLQMKAQAKRLASQATCLYNPGLPPPLAKREQRGLRPRDKPPFVLLCSGEAANKSVTRQKSQDSRPAPYCPFCNNKEHCLGFCPDFKKLSTGESKKWIQEGDRCFKCGRSHRARACTLKGPCKTCKETHLTVLHDTIQELSQKVLMDVSAVNSASDMMDSMRSEERVVEDEFACPGMLRGSLTSLHSAVERIFRVHFSIGSDQPPQDGHGQIWLKLRGLSSDVDAAKLFVKGVVNQEEQQEVPYPPTLHCVFCGARGLFMDCLMRNTSALIVIGSSGCLLLSGLMEPVVRALSLITDLVERCDASLPKRSELGERGLGESLESRRAFKNLVEQWDDRHTLDLLVLPGSVKEILLDLIKEARLGDNPRPLQMDVVKTEDTWDKSVTSLGESSSRDGSANFLNSFGESGGARGSPEGTEESSKSPQEVGEEEETLARDEDDEDDKKQWAELSGGKEFWLLLQFFTAMGYTEDVVERVLAKTGLQEASQILDLVQQEQDRTDRGLRNGQDSTQAGIRAKELRNKPCETEHREDGGKRQAVLTTKREMGSGDEVNSATGGAGELRSEDFVFGVLKKAAASCGYNEKRVTEAYSKVPDRSMHQLLLELQRKDDSKQSGFMKEGPREMDEVAFETPKVAKERAKVRENAEEKSVTLPKRQSFEEDAMWVEVSQMQKAKQQKKRDANGPKQQSVAENMRGPPLSSYNSNNGQYFTNDQASNQAKQAHLENDQAPFNLGNYRPQPSHVRRFEMENGNDWSAPRGKDRRGQQGAVTGEQRFLEGLHSQFELRLTDRQGNSKLRNIVIDGSNVAMTHGLGLFFSCRGIALAVQHFWDRGHRQISALVPQWRTKSDPKIKEQHYLTELKELGIVSLTPSREVQGKRISSYDDRLMLQLAQKTDGVIVTNDNLRDLSDESVEWRDIIKERLLQYTFAGDLFMVPDDPLGRTGPHLDEFLSTEPRAPDFRHTFGAVPFPASILPRPNGEPLNYRDRSPRGAWEAQGGRRKETGAGGARAGGPRAGPRTGPERSPGETARLRQELALVFPGQENMVTLVLQSHPHVSDINDLSALLLEEN